MNRLAIVVAVNFAFVFFIFRNAGWFTVLFFASRSCFMTGDAGRQRSKERDWTDSIFEQFFVFGRENVSAMTCTR